MLTKITVFDFRHLKNISFQIGKRLTVIAGGNGTGKTTLLGLLGHCFKYDKETRDLLGDRFETVYSDVFRISTVNDSKNEYKYTVDCEKSIDGLLEKTTKTAQLRFATEKGKPRHRIDVGGRQRGAGKWILPVTYLSLKRLVPLAQENDYYINTKLTKTENSIKNEYNEIYNSIFSTTDTINPQFIESYNKKLYSPSTNEYDAFGTSAGQDNIGQIILAILSFKNIKQRLGNKYEGGLLLIDEIDATLYPASQKNLLKKLFEYSNILNLQIVFTTHSSDILNFLNSNKASLFKHSTSYVNLSNSNGALVVREGVKAIEDLLLDLNHDALISIKPKQINIYFEDSEACLFFKALIDSQFFISKGYSIKLQDKFSLGCGTYKKLLENGFEEFDKCLVVLDGDAKETFSDHEKHNVVFLPGVIRPESIIRNFLSDLPFNDAFWINDAKYSKRVFLQSISDIGYETNKDRKIMKDWFNNQLLFWGVDGANVFGRWKELNKNTSDQFKNTVSDKLNLIVTNFHMSTSGRR